MVNWKELLKTAESVFSRLKLKHECTLKFQGDFIAKEIDPITRQVRGVTTGQNIFIDIMAEELVRYLTNLDTPSAAGNTTHMGIGSSATAEDHAQTALIAEYSTGGYARIAGTVSRQQESHTSKYKIFRMVAEFPAAGGAGARGSVAEFGCVNGLAGIKWMNRGVLSPVRDNNNNALEITYNLTVSPAS